MAQEIVQKKRVSEESRKKISEGQKKRWATIPAEERQRFSERMSKIMQKYWDALSPKEEIAFRKKRSQAYKDIWKKRTPEQRAEISRNISEGLRKRREASK